MPWQHHLRQGPHHSQPITMDNRLPPAGKLPAGAVKAPLPTTPLPYHPLLTIGQCRAAATLHYARRVVAGVGGDNWFSPQSMRYMGSSVVEGLWPVPDGALFITYDRMPDHFNLGPGPHLAPKQGYTLRHCCSDGQVSTLGVLAGHPLRGLAATAASGAQRLMCTLGGLGAYLEQTRDEAERVA